MNKKRRLLRIIGVAKRHKEKSNPTKSIDEAYYLGPQKILKRKADRIDKESTNYQIRVGLLKIIPNKKRR